MRTHNRIIQRSLLSSSPWTVSKESRHTPLLVSVSVFVFKFKFLLFLVFLLPCGRLSWLLPTFERTLK